jgi:predicted  nucleic acid-binding Zn-ribbon protein
MRAFLLVLALLGGVSTTAACKSVYYDVWESLGKEKRDLLKSEITGMVDDQREAEETFTDALTRMKQLTAFDGGELEDEYDRLKDANDDALASAQDIDKRMEDIHTVAEDLFIEWEQEIGTMQTPSLKSASRSRLQETKHKYAMLDRNLTSTRASMDPVLAFLHDHVLYLKHNLNAQAIGALGQEMGTVERDIEGLRSSIQRSIDEAQRFLATMQ